MKTFEYVRATSVAEALVAAAGSGAHFLAGGTNIVDLMKGGAVVPSRLVDINGIPGLDQIQFQPNGDCRIGALVSNTQLSRHTQVLEQFPAVVEALLSGASAQLRNVATVGGNILQQTRCSYYYDTASPCNRRHAHSGCAALHGENASHAVVGWTTSCIATHPSDLCVALAALGAIVELESAEGVRHMTMDELYALPDAQGIGGPSLLPSEMVVAITIPAEAAKFAEHSCYLKVRDRTSFAFALVSTTAALRLEGDRVLEARIALGGVAHKPWRAYNAEQTLKNAFADTDAFARAAVVAMNEAAPSGDNSYKIELARRIISSALSRAVQGSQRNLRALPASPFSRSAQGE